jgi:hypothetical protein
MKSIFNAADNAEFIDRIDRLQADAPALWGKMTAAQMLKHSQLLLNLVLGDIKLERVFLGRIFGSIAKKDIFKDEPVKRNLPTFKKAKITGNRNFTEEKDKLKALLQRLLKTGYDGSTPAIHPFFGKLTPTEWDQLNVKHLDHHLRQFGV